MSKISRRGMRITAAAAGAGVIAATAWASTIHAGPANAATSAVVSGASSKIRVHLVPMPQGTVIFDRNSRGEVYVMVNVFGLTPGSSHNVELMNGRGVVARFSPLTANSRGQARDERLDSRYAGSLGSLRVGILNGSGGAPVELREIARTGAYNGTQRTYQLVPVETGENGKVYGTPAGVAVIAYDRNAETLSVTVTSASGFTPGAHAAHIHFGSCDAQGPVKYMLRDFTADRGGRIVDETRVVTHVTTRLPAGGWYLNLHQGSSRDILANGRPTISFRPLLCSDIGSVG